MLSEQALEVKKQLEEHNQTKRKISNLKWEIAELIRLGSIPKRFNGGGGGKTLLPSSTQEKYILKIEALKSKLNKTIELAVEQEHIILEEIKELDTLSQNLLMERYLQGKSLKRIVSEYNYCDRQIIRIYNRAFERLGSKARR